jgi:zinc ribbon protein
MDCPRCGTANADGVQFCTNCHATLFFKCPKCEHTQSHGVICEKCGANFALFWSSYLLEKREEDEQLKHDKVKAAESLAFQAVTLPLFGGRWLSRFFLGQVIGRVLSYFNSR